MIARQLNAIRFNIVHKNIMKYGRSKPLCPTYEIDIVFNGSKYVLTIQPDGHNKIVALYAIVTYVELGDEEVNHVLITENAVLSALLEMVLFQGIK